MIEIKHLYHRYIKEYYALFDINLHIEKGEKVALIGSEDSGKTSLIRILSKLERATSGEILIDGKNLNDIDYKNNISVGYVPVYPIFFEKKSVFDNFAYVLKFRGVNKEDYENIIMTTLKDFGLEKFKDVQIKKLSLYEKYKLSFARLALRKLDVLLIDNIFDNFGELQVEQSQDILNIVKKYASQKDCTLLMATSDESLADIVAERKIYFKSGSVVPAL